MQIIIENTTKIVELSTQENIGVKVPARIWEGRTMSGIPVICFVTRIAVQREEDTEQFEKELQECREPSEGASSFPASLIL